MPRENKSRGRRAQAKDATTKRKHDGDEDPDPSQKRRKVELDETPWSEEDIEQDYAVANNEEEHNADVERPFYGLLDDQEQEYFKKADNMLETNQFDHQDERALFLENVYKEAVGKELKLACSQSCSRLMERLVMLSSPQQLKHLFQSFNGHFLHLVQHRFASHCCETLFIKSAPVITSEMLESPLDDATTMSEESPFVSMENLFLYVLNELSGKLGYLMTERFASHTFRVLLRIFSGETLVASETSKAGHRKGHADDSIKAEKARELTLDQARTVPESFETALRKMIEESLAGLDPHYLQTLATHPNGSPVLQQLVEHELKHHKKEAANDQNSVLRRLLPETSDLENTSSATFINGLLYDPVGSRLLESIIKNAPAKLFKAMWKDLFRERFGVLARNEVAGYVMSTILQRLSREDLQVAHDAMLEQIPNLAQRGRTAIIRTLVERCKVRGLDTTRLRDAILNCWAEEDDGKSFSVCSMLDIPTTVQEGCTEPHRGSIKHHSSMPINKPTEDPDISTKAPTPNLRHSASAPTQTSDTASVMHRSLLAQTMLSSPGPLSEMLFQSLSRLSSAVCLHLASTSSLSPILQTSLTVPHATLIYRRKLITRFYSHLGALSIDPSGSHLVDAIWAGTHGMAFARERVAEELAENEKQLRGSNYGRKVWRNWKMDLYQRRRAQWVREMREQVGNDGFQSFPDGVADGSSRHSSTRPSSRGSARSRANSGASRAGSSRSFEAGSNASEKSKSALDRARERHARKQQVGHQHQHQHSQQRGSGANAEAMHPARQRKVEG